MHRKRFMPGILHTAQRQMCASYVIQKLLFLIRADILRYAVYHSQWGVVPEGRTDTDLNVNVEKTLMLVVIDIAWVDGGIYNVLWRADKSTANHIVFQVSSSAIGGYGYVAFCRLSMS